MKTKPSLRLNTLAAIATLRSAGINPDDISDEVLIDASAGPLDTVGVAIDASITRDSDFDFRLQRHVQSCWVCEERAKLQQEAFIRDQLRYLRDVAIGPQCPASEFEPSPSGKHLRLKKGGKKR